MLRSTANIDREMNEEGGCECIELPLNFPEMSYMDGLAKQGRSTAVVDVVLASNERAR